MQTIKSNQNFSQENAKVQETKKPILKCSPIDAANGATLTIVKQGSSDRLQALIDKLYRAELFAFIVDESVSRASRIASISRIDDIELLISLASSDAPLFVKKNALQRLDELWGTKAIEKELLYHLLPSLDEKELIAHTVTLLDMYELDWAQYCTPKTVEALSFAMYECSDIHTSIILEDAFAYLTHKRPDLGENLRAYNPEGYHLRTTYTPIISEKSLFADLHRKPNVA